MFGWEIQLLDSSLAKVGVLWNPTAEVPSGDCVVTENVEGIDELEYTNNDLDTHMANLIADSAFIRLVDLNSPTTIRTYNIVSHDTEHRRGGEAIRVKGERIWIHLKDRFIYAETKEFANIQIGTLLADILATSGADADFQIGTVASNTEVVDFFKVNHNSALWCFRQLAAKMGREMELDESTTPDTLNFPATIGNATSNAQLRYGFNLQGITRTVDKSRMATRVYGVGGGSPSMKLTASSLAGGVNYVEDATEHAKFNRIAVYHNPDLEDIDNLVATNPDLSGTYTAGLCAGWTKIGTPTVSENTTATFYQYGTKSQKVVANTDGQGIQTTFVAPTNGERLVFWVNIYIELASAGAAIIVEASDGTAVYKNGDGAITVGGFTADERRDMSFTGASGTLKIYLDGGNATFYVDAGFVAVAEDFKQFVVGDMADVLYNETNDRLTELKTPETTYVVDALNLYDADPKKWADYAVALGDTIKVIDDDLSVKASVRVKQRTWNVIRPETSGFQVGNVVKSLDSFLVDDQQKFRVIDEQTRSGQEQDDRAGEAVSGDRPVSDLETRFSGQFRSDDRNSFSWTAGTLHVGTNLSYSIGVSSISGLTASTTYYVYFDLDAPTNFLTTAAYLTSIGHRKASIAVVVTGALSERGLTIVTYGKPQDSGSNIITGEIRTNRARVKSPGAESVTMDNTGIYSGPSYGHSTSRFGVRASDGAAYFDGTINAAAVITAPIDSNAITRTATGASRVIMDKNGISGYNASSVNTFDINTNGSGHLGDSGGNPITWTTTGVLIVPGEIIATGINAGRISTGKMQVGGSGNDRIDIDWTTKDFVLYRGGNAKVDLGNISGLGASNGRYGLHVDDTEGMIYLDRRGAKIVTASSIQPKGIVSNITRNANQAHTGTAHEAAIQAKIFLAAPSSGSNSDAWGFMASIENNKGKAFGFITEGQSTLQPNGVEGSEEATGYYAHKIKATDAAANAYGFRTNTIDGGSSGSGIGIYIGNDIDGGGTNYAIKSDATENATFSGILEVVRSSTLDRLQRFGQKIRIRGKFRRDDRGHA